MAGRDNSPIPSTGTEIAGSSCRVEIWHSPETELETYECFVPGEVQYESGDELPSENNSKVKEWQCDCNGKNLTVEASGCADALQNGCGVAQDSETTFCRNYGDVFSVCWIKEDTGWQCGCGDPVDTVTLVDQDDQECIDALFHACAQPCEGPLGQCDPLRETDEVGFQCDCTYYGEISRKTWARDCQSALRNVCHPSYSNYSESCNGYVGYCDRSEFGYACHCLNGLEQSIESIEMSEIGCYLALEQVCGENQPPEDSICRVESSDESSSGQGYCVQIGEELYECDCSGETDLLIAASCEEALIFACPDLIRATPEQKNKACEIMVDCYSFINENPCIDRRWQTRPNPHAFDRRIPDAPRCASCCSNDQEPKRSLPRS